MHTPATHSSCIPDVTDLVKMAVLMAMLLQLSNVIYQHFVDWTSDAFLTVIPFNLVWAHGEKKSGTRFTHRSSRCEPLWPGGMVLGW